MELKIYENFPSQAMEVREAVFVKEQGFRDEFDETDRVAAHFVLFDGEDRPVATCRVFWDSEMEAYILGRLAVLREYRGRELGSLLVQEAEKYVRQKGGGMIALHSQCRAAAFYKKLGFMEFGEIGDDEGCPHIWMKKCLK